MTGHVMNFEQFKQRDYHLIPKPLYWAFYRLPDYHKQRKALNQIRADITSFLEEQERFQQFTLYFLELRTDSHIYHKIGITGRTVKERVAEVEQDARKLGSVQIAVKHQVKGYAFLETFFKHKYADYQLEFGQYTEYFDLPADILKGIEEDLNRLEYLSLDRIGKIKAGMQKAKEQGKHVGRPAEQEKTQEFLQKPKSQEILTLLQQGFALREIERQTGYAINTIRKVKNAMQ